MKSLNAALLLVACLPPVAGCRGTSQAERMIAVAESRASNVESLHRELSIATQEIENAGEVNESGLQLLTLEHDRIQRDIARLDAALVDLTEAPEMDRLEEALDRDLQLHREIDALRMMILVAKASSKDDE